MSKLRRVKFASIRLALEFEARYEALATAVGEDETIKAAADLGMLFNDNIEFIIYALKKTGGMNPPTPDEIAPPVPPMPAVLADLN